MKHDEMFMEKIEWNSILDSMASDYEDEEEEEWPDGMTLAEYKAMNPSRY